MHSLTFGLVIISLFCILKCSFCEDKKTANFESKVTVKRSANGAEVPIEKVRKVHRKKILKSKKKTVKKKRRKKKKGKVKLKKAKKFKTE